MTIVETNKALTTLFSLACAPQAIGAAASASMNPGALITSNPSLQKFSYKNVKLAVEFFQNGGSCPALPESGTANGGCKTLNEGPNQAACTPYTASRHFAIIKEAKGANVPKEEVAKNQLNFVPWEKVLGAYNAA